MNKDPAILYVENDVQSREIMSLLLTEVMGLSNVTIFADSSDFLPRVEQIQPKPAVILLDIHVPPHDGLDMLQMLRRQGGFHHTPIVALTASVMHEEVHRLKVAGFNGVIPKPIDLDVFPDMLNQILRGVEIWHVIQ